MTGATAPDAIVLFDGECALCNGSVQWLLRHERSPRYRFAPLQSAAAAPLLASHNISAADRSSVVVIDGPRAYRKSSAALHLLRDVRGPWRALALLRLVPRGLRDWGYDAIGARRYRWFGTAATCVLEQPEWRARQWPAEPRPAQDTL